MANGLSTQAFGHDARDGTASGRILTASVRGELVKQFWKATDFVISAAGSATAFLNAGQTPLNSDRSGVNLQIAVPVDGAGGGTQGLSVQHQFWGRVYGIRYVSNYSAPNQDFSLFIDGQAHLVVHARLQSDSQTSLPPSHDYEGMYLVDELLPEGYHMAELWFPAGTFGTSANQILGYLTERRAGHQDAPPAGMMYEIAITGTSGAPQVVSSNTNARCVEALRFFNTAGSNRTVTILSNGVQVDTPITLATNTGAIWYVGAKIAPSQLTSNQNSLSVYADNTGVNMFVIGGY